MENNTGTKLYITQNGSCPILSVKVSPKIYHYSDPVAFADITDKQLTRYERILFREEISEDSADSFALFEKYCAGVIGDHICGKLSFEEASEKLVMVSHYFSKSFPCRSILVQNWLCGMYLVNGRQSQISFLPGKGVSNIPFAGDYAVCVFVDAFLSKNDTAFDAGVFTALNYISGFDCKRSPAYLTDKEKYEKAVPAVMKRVLASIIAEKGRSFLVPESKIFKTQAFRGLFCPQFCERELEITYIPYSENTELKEFLGACIRHADNLMRQGCGIRSKLVGFILSPEYRKLVSDTIREALPGFLPQPMKAGRKPKEKTLAMRAKKAEDDRITKEQQEPVDLNIDFARAKKLEAESWKLASMLGADYGVADISFNIGEGSEKDVELPEKTQSTEMPVQTDIPEDWQEFFAVLDDDEKKLLCLISNGSNLADFAKKRGGMLMGYADRINEKSSDTYGDIILSCDGTKTEFIEDYKQELTDIFKDMYNTEVL